MNVSVQAVLDSFDKLPPLKKWQVASEIIKRTKNLEFPPLADEDLVLAAEALFLELDQNEATNEQAATG